MDITVVVEGIDAIQGSLGLHSGSHDVAQEKKSRYRHVTKTSSQGRRMANPLPHLTAVRITFIISPSTNICPPSFTEHQLQFAFYISTENATTNRSRDPEKPRRALARTTLCQRAPAVYAAFVFPVAPLQTSSFPVVRLTVRVARHSSPRHCAKLLCL